MNSPSELPRLNPLLRSQAEERLNAVTHGLGLLLSVIGGGVLIGVTAASGDVWRLAACSLFSGALVCVYLCSTLSHAVTSVEAKSRWRVWDQASIYVLIAASYTPFGLTYLRHGWWPLLTACIWALAAYGFCQKVCFAHRVNSISIGLYLVMGWLPLLTLRPLLETIPLSALLWMLVGGVFYTAGTLFLVRDSLVPHFHAVWHLFVLVGSACHYWAILRFVAWQA